MIDGGPACAARAVQVNLQLGGELVRLADCRLQTGAWQCSASLRNSTDCGRSIDPSAGGKFAGACCIFPNRIVGGMVSS